MEWYSSWSFQRKSASKTGINGQVEHHFERNCQSINKQTQQVLLNLDCRQFLKLPQFSRTQGLLKMAPRNLVCNKTGSPNKYFTKKENHFKCFFGLTWWI